MSELVLKSYKKKDIDAFLLELNAEHLRAITEKDDEIKRVFSEREHYREQCELLSEKLERAQESHNAELESKQRELDAINARLGEKISAAEKAASGILEDAEREKALAHEKAVAESAAYVADVKRRADALLEKAQAQTRACLEGQRRAEQTIAMLNKQLDDTVAQFGELVK